MVRSFFKHSSFVLALGLIIGTSLPSPASAVETGSFKVQAEDGIELHVRRFLVPNPKKVLIVVHGLLEHSGRWTDFAERMQSEGYSVYAGDHRGHGLSGGPRGHVKKFSQYVDDLQAITEEVLKRESGTDVVLVGYSLGGLVSLYYGSRPEGFPSRVKGLVAVSPGFSFDPPPILNCIATTLNNCVTGRVKAKPISLKKLTNSEEELKKYKKDPLVLKRVTMHMGREEIIASKQAPDMIRAWKYPMLLLQASADTIVDVQTNLELLDEVPTGVPVGQAMMDGGMLHDLFHNKPDQVDELYYELTEFLERF